MSASSGLRTLHAAVLTAALVLSCLVLTGGAAHATPVAAPAPGGSIVPVTPRRILDTRLTTPGPDTRAVIADPVAGIVPLSSVSAVLLDVTVVGAAAPGFVDVTPVDARPDALSTGNFVAGAPSATTVMVTVGGPDGVMVRLSQPADVVVDLQGYVTTAATATSATFTAISPRRVADSRTSAGLTTLGPRSTQRLALRRRGGLPADATAAVVNLTVASSSASTFVTAWGGGSRPPVSNLDAQVGQVVANRALLPLDGSGAVSLYNLAGRTDLVVDVVGYVSPDQDGGFFVGDGTLRIADRSGTRQVVTSPTVAGAWAPQQPSGGGLRAPTTNDLAATTAVWLGVVGDDPAGPGFVSVGGGSSAATSDLNVQPGRAVANTGPVAVAPDGTVTVSASVPTRLIVDVDGWFTRRPAARPAPAVWSTQDIGGPSPIDLLSTVPSGLPAAFASGVGGDGADGTTMFALRDGTVVWSRITPAPPIGTANVGLGTWSAPQAVPGWDGVTALASGGGRTLPAVYGLGSDGSIRATGSNASGELASPPSATDTIATPVTIPLPEKATAVYAADGVGYAVLADGTVWSWGRSNTYQLGRPPTSTPWVPAPVTGLTSPRAVAGAGGLTFALLADGRTVFWGYDPVENTRYDAPTFVNGNCPSSSALSVVRSNGGFERCDDGRVAELTVGASSPLYVAGLDDVVAIAPGTAGSTDVRALTADGTVLVGDGWNPANPAMPFPGLVGVTALGGTPAVGLASVVTARG